MARRVKAQLNEYKVDSALEEMIDMQFDESISVNDLIDSDDTIIDIDQLAQQIALATAEDAQPEKQFTQPSVDDSVAEQLFKKASNDTPTPAGTVKDQVIAQSLKAANDDRGTLWMNRTQKPISFKRLYMGTTALSALWAAGGIAFAHKLSVGGAFSLSSLGSFFSSPIGLAVSAGTVLPIAMFWGFAQLTKRSKELQSAIYSISDAATRLVAPDNSSEAHLNQVGTNVRQEILMMNQGIEKTISRAVELEALIQGEVKNLERAYSENENRIHNLIKELSSEREAILGHADQVKSIIRNSQDQLSGEFSALTSNISIGVEDISNTLSNTVKENGEKLIESLHNASDAVSQKISNRVDIDTKDLSTKLTNTTEQALAEFETKLNAFDNKMIERTNSSLSGFDDNVTKLSDRFNTVSSVFNSATEQAIHAFEDRLSNIDNLLNERSSSIIHSFIARAESLDQNADKLGDILEERVSRITQTLKDRTDDISNAFESGQVEMDGALKQRIGDISAVFESGQVEIDGALKQRIGDISAAFESGQVEIDGALKQRIGDISAAFESGQVEIDGALKQRIGDISAAFENGNVQVNDALQQRITDINTVFTGNNKEIHTSFSKYIEDMSRVVGTNYQSLNAILQKRLLEITSAYESGNTQVSTNLNSYVEKIAHSLNDGYAQFSNYIEQRSNDVLKVFEGKNDLTNENLKARTAEIEKTFENGWRYIDNTLNQRIEDIINNVSGSQSSLDETIKGHLVEVMNAFNRNRDEISNSMRERLFEMTSLFAGEKSNIDSLVQVVATRLSQEADKIDQTISNVIDNRADSLVSQLESGRINFEKAIKNSGDEIIYSVNEQIGSLSHHVSDIEKAVVDNIQLVNSHFTEHSENIGVRTNALIQTIEDNKKYLNILSDQTNIVKSSIEQSSNLFASLDNTTNKLQQTFSAHGALIEEQTIVFNKTIENSLSVINQDFSQHVSQIDNSLNSIVQKTVHTAGEVGDKLNQTVLSFETGLEQARYTLSQETERVAESFQDKISAITQDVSGKIIQSSEVITTIGQEASKNIELATASIGERISNIANAQINNFSVQIENMNKASETLYTVADQTSRSFGELSNEFAKKLNEASIIAREDLRRGNEDIVTAFSHNATETIASIQSTHNDIQQNMNVVLSNVDSAVSQLNQSVGMIHNSSNEFISHVNEADNKFAQSNQSFNDNIRAARETLDQSSGLLNTNIDQMRDVSSLAIDQMKNIGQDFSHHSALLEKAATILQNSHNDFATSLENQHKQIDNITGGLAQKSDEIAETIKRYSSLLFDKMKETQDYSKQSASDMQNELVSLVEQAVQKFSTATEEIRKSAKAVDLEIQTMTHDIHQSVEAMPMQARQSTEVMRNAISDQIAALKELSHLMGQSATVAEISNASELPQDAFIPLKIDREQKHSIKTPSAETVYPSNKARKQGGWVSELLARASRDDKENEIEDTDVQVLDDIKTITKNVEKRKEPKQERVESLNSMAIEIVKAFDDEAIVELWGDYRRGRNNINIQKLYTAQGQNIYQRVSDKYLREADFKQSVNQYIADFEHVLRDVQKSQGKDAVRNYLVSDPGKVYTMLAHISGRIQ